MKCWKTAKGDEQDIQLIENVGSFSLQECTPEEEQIVLECLSKHWHVVKLLNATETDAGWFGNRSSSVSYCNIGTEHVLKKNGKVIGFLVNDQDEALKGRLLKPEVKGDWIKIREDEGTTEWFFLDQKDESILDFMAHYFLQVRGAKTLDYKFSYDDVMHYGDELWADYEHNVFSKDDLNQCRTLETADGVLELTLKQKA